MNVTKAFPVAVLFWVVGVLCQLALVVGLAYAAIHFIEKYW